MEYPAESVPTFKQMIQISDNLETKSHKTQHTIKSSA